MVALIQSWVLRSNLCVRDHVAALVIRVTEDRSQGALTLLAASGQSINMNRYQISMSTPRADRQTRSQGSALSILMQGESELQPFSIPVTS